MSRGNRRTLLFKDASDHIRFLESIIRAKEIYPFRIHALCLRTLVSVTFNGATISSVSKGFDDDFANYIRKLLSQQVNADGR